MVDISHRDISSKQGNNPAKHFWEPPGRSGGYKSQPGHYLKKKYQGHYKIGKCSKVIMPDTNVMKFVFLVFLKKDINF